GPGAHVIILSGQGYSLLWPEGTEPVRVEWQPGSVVVPPSQWFHQHFNSGAGPARYLALRKGGGGRDKFPIVVHDREAGQSIKEGGSQIEYEDEEASIHQQFEAALAKASAHCAMGELHPRCSTRQFVMASTSTEKHSPLVVLWVLSSAHLTAAQFN